MQGMIVGVFEATDSMLFYFFWEGMLIPMYLSIGIWGGERRSYAAIKFFLYTLAGSVLMLLALLTIYLEAGTTDIPTILENTQFTLAIQIWLWLAFFASFAVKVPMWPVHTWLPDAHVQAPTAGSVILAGILLKMGAYGFLLLNYNLLPVYTIIYRMIVFLGKAFRIVFLKF